MRRWKPFYRWGPNRGVPRARPRASTNKGTGRDEDHSTVATAFFAVLSIAAFLGALSTAGLFIVLRAAAADLPRKDAPPTLSAPIGKDAPPTLLASIDPVGITRREIERSN